MSGISCDSLGFAGETTVGNVFNARKRGPDDLFNRPHSTLEGLAAGDDAGTVPYSDAAAQDALSSVFE